MNILDKIVQYKAQELEFVKKHAPLESLKNSPSIQRKTYSLKKSLLENQRSGIIAEFKTQSPSKGVIKAAPKDSSERAGFVQSIVKAYEEAQASALSVLTDGHFFAGFPEDLQAAREVVNIPILRKDFMIDPYQVWEAKAWGADIILLIAACLSTEKTLELAHLAQELGLEVLLEVHNQAELEGHLNQHIDLVGVNNRDLKTFQVSVQTSLNLAPQIPDEFVKISESGLGQTSDIARLWQAGFRGFLIGESLMKTENPGQTCAALAQDIEIQKTSLEA